MYQASSDRALSAGAHIWYRETRFLSRDDVAAADNNLSREERTRRDRLYFEADRRDFTIAHDLLRRTLSRYRKITPQAWRFASNRHGKPEVDSADPELTTLSFSLTHTRGFVACAVADHAAVGVDIERVDRSVQVQELADQYFDATEAAWLRRSAEPERAQRFIELWTLKEALLKARGVGLSNSLASVSFRFESQGIIIVTGVVDPADWHVALFVPWEGVRLAVALQGVRRPQFRAFEDGANDTLLCPRSLSQ